MDYLLYAGAKAIGVVEAEPRGLDPEPRSRNVFTFHRPEELLRLVSQDQQLRQRLRHLPVLVTGKLWPVQVEAIQNQVTTRPCTRRKRLPVGLRPLQS